MLKPLRITGSAEDGEWPERDMHVYDFHCIFSLKKKDMDILCMRF